MAIQKMLLALIMMVFFLPSQGGYAGQCDEIYAKAKDLRSSAGEALNRREYSRASELYREAARYFEQASNMRDCECPKIHAASRTHADSCREMADKSEKAESEYTTELGLIEQYNQAKARFIEGNAFAKSREWDNAIAAFDDAAVLFEGVASRSQTENSKKASDSAQQARDAGNLAREYQQRQ